MRTWTWALAGLLYATGVQAAVIVTWQANTEADLNGYVVQYASTCDGPWTELATTGRTPTFTDTAHDDGAYRVAAFDTIGHKSAFTPCQLVILAPPPATPPPSTPPAPPVVKPGPLTGLRVTDMTQTTAIIRFDPVDGAKANLRLSLAPMAWGTATSITCSESEGTCQLANLLPGTTYQTQGVRYFGVMNQGAIYGELSAVMSFTTAPVVPTPPSAPTPVPPSPPMPPPALGLKDALQNGLDTCLTRKLAHTACMKALSEALGKVSP